MGTGEGSKLGGAVGSTVGNGVGLTVGTEGGATEGVFVGVGVAADTIAKATTSTHAAKVARFISGCCKTVA